MSAYLREKHALGPGTLLADQRYCLQERLIAHPLTDALQEQLWVAQDRQHSAPVLLHELVLRGAPLSLRQRVLRCILQARDRLHPPFAGIHDCFSQGETLFFATSLPQGEALSRRREPLSEEETLRCCLDLCDLLAVLAQQGIVHGLLSPAHLIRQPSGSWTLLLPLTSLLVATQVLAWSEDWQVTPPFPGARRTGEQADSDAVVALAFSALTGTRPRTSPFVSERFPGGHLAPDLLRLFARGSHPQVEQRYQSLAELRADLERISANRGNSPLPSGQRRAQSGRLAQITSHRPPHQAPTASPLWTLPGGAVPVAGGWRASATHHRVLASPVAEPRTIGDYLVPAGWIVGSSALLLFLATRGG